MTTTDKRLAALEQQNSELSAEIDRLREIEAARTRAAAPRPEKPREAWMTPGGKFRPRPPAAAGGGGCRPTCGRPADRGFAGKWKRPARQGPQNRRLARARRAAGATSSPPHFG